jgi:Cd(II)/Pb(II)-responsive transcriptional regulator
MRIGKLARVTGTPVETIRYYEREGLLDEPARTGGNFRIYADAHAERLSFIRHCRSLDMALDEIRILLRFKDMPTENCNEVSTLLEAHIGHVAARIRDLRALEKQLKSLRERCAEGRDAAHCGILNALSQSCRRSAAPSAGHLSGVHRRARGSRT